MRRPGRTDSFSAAWMASVLAALALAWIGGIGTTVCYHRAITHRALKLNPLVRGILIFFAMFNGSGAPVSWASNHRLHHASADTEDDISSPRQGFWVGASALAMAGAERHRPSGSVPDLNRFSYNVWTFLQGADSGDLAYFGGLYFGLRGVLLARRDSAGVRAARAMLREQRVPYRAGRARRSGFQPQRAMARADAFFPGRELASQSSLAPRPRAAGMELASTGCRLSHHSRAGENRARERCARLPSVAVAIEREVAPLRFRHTEARAHQCTRASFILREPIDLSR